MQIGNLQTFGICNIDFEDFDDVLHLQNERITVFRVGELKPDALKLIGPRHDLIFCVNFFELNVLKTFNVCLNNRFSR